jgi:hypothetical protein
MQKTPQADQPAGFFFELAGFLSGAGSDLEQVNAPTGSLPLLPANMKPGLN